jgi:FkbM family methyltransferase
MDTLLPGSCPATAKLDDVVRLWLRAAKYRWRLRTEFKIIAGLVEPASTVFDIGAYKGAYTFWFQRWVGRNGIVLAFEPQPAAAQLLQTLANRQKWKHVTVINAAASARSGCGSLLIPNSDRQPSQAARLLPAHAPPQLIPRYHHVCQVKTICLDDLLQNGVAPGFIKCDCEGHELSVLEGASRILEVVQPVILLECEQRHRPDRNVQPVFDYLRGAKYNGWFFSQHGLVPLAQFNPELHQAENRSLFWKAKTYCNNFLFRPTDRS